MVEIQHCKRHGFVNHFINGRYWRCSKCSAESVTRSNRKRKAILVDEAGGKCAICGYDKCHRALHFHHLDPLTKKRGIGFGGCKAIEDLRQEVAKCVLLCSNCHMEVEEGITKLPNG